MKDAIKGHLVADVISPGHVAGDFSWINAADGEASLLQFRCPGCAMAVTLPVAPSFGIRSYWGWNGDRVYPTLDLPILHVMDDCRWQGRVSGGSFVPLEDYELQRRNHD
jgi:hypothetical protein